MGAALTSYHELSWPFLFYEVRGDTRYITRRVQLLSRNSIVKTRGSCITDATCE